MQRDKYVCMGEAYTFFFCLIGSKASFLCPLRHSDIPHSLGLSSLCVEGKVVCSNYVPGEEDAELKHTIKEGWYSYLCSCAMKAFMSTE
jgi:hypothetical protein